MLSKKEKMKAIVNHFPERHQLHKLREELDELRAEVERHICADYPPAEVFFLASDYNFQSELADVLVMCNQFKLMIGPGKIEKIERFKIDRTLARNKIKGCP